MAPTASRTPPGSRVFGYGKSSSSVCMYIFLSFWKRRRGKATGQGGAMHLERGLLPYRRGKSRPARKKRTVPSPEGLLPTYLCTAIGSPNEQAVKLKPNTVQRPDAVSVQGSITRTATQPAIWIYSYNQVLWLLGGARWSHVPSVFPDQRHVVTVPLPTACDRGALGRWRAARPFSFHMLPIRQKTFLPPSAN